MFIELTQIVTGKVLINLNRVEVVMPRKENEENTILLLSDGDFVRVEEDYETIKQRIKNLVRVEEDYETIKQRIKNLERQK